jgi:predicted house-cleaning noncanonical NTP pyrophosphatase (MazG superfamily)
MKTYNKLVRDRIPDIILKDHCLPTTRILDDAEYLEELNKKLLEEVNEYLKDDNIEEMVDILEVIRAILEFKGTSYDEIEEKRIKKLKKRGGFKDKVYLEKVMESGD